MYRFRHVHYSLRDSGAERTTQLHHHQIHTLFHELIHKPWGCGTWEPPMDILETENEYQILVDLPGVAQDHIQVSLEDDILVITGTKPPPGSNNIIIHLSERNCGDFTRTVQFQTPIDPDKLTADLQNGVLKINISKNGGESKR
ncbi:Spore protein SP21 [Anaerohalosphaera lusitana]|uniref:Spore protein SP21 n=1 Tax=Anaerohalosphaera lusitana TaxID=1936003 RepID=A0A1U9NKI7_9BACT|nr:Hsp20/alpha crystallin family protein [Anaerohalosphaera lusitana]AQT68452.1 Spore protein SP21 [Anaerohalosphaera lusitana]